MGSIILWIIFGALVGWTASIIMRTNEEQGAMANVIIGIIGAFIGGAVSRLIGGPSLNGFNLTSVVVAVIGSVILLFFIRLLTGGGRSTTLNH